LADVANGAGGLAECRTFPALPERNSQDAPVGTVEILWRASGATLFKIKRNLK